MSGKENLSDKNRTRTRACKGLVGEKRTASDRSPVSKDPLKKYSNQKLVKKARVQKNRDDSNSVDFNSASAEAKLPLKLSNDSPVGTPPRGVTPYWKVAEERGTSPRETRSASAKKTKKKSRDDTSLEVTLAANFDSTSSLAKSSLNGDRDDLTSSSTAHLSILGQTVLVFSPPNYAENVKREKMKDKERREKLRQRTRKEGDVYFLSRENTESNLVVPHQNLIREASVDDMKSQLEKLKHELDEHQHRTFLQQADYHEQLAKLQELLTLKQNELDTALENSTCVLEERTLQLQEKNEQMAKLQELLTLKQNELDTAIENSTFALDERTLQLQEKNEQMAKLQELLTLKQNELDTALENSTCVLEERTLQLQEKNEQMAKLQELVTLKQNELDTALENSTCVLEERTLQLQEKNEQMAKLQELLTLKQNELDTALENSTCVLEERTLQLQEKNEQMAKLQELLTLKQNELDTALKNSTCVLEERTLQLQEKNEQMAKLQELLTLKQNELDTAIENSTFALDERTLQLQEKNEQIAKLQELLILKQNELDELMTFSENYECVLANSALLTEERNIQLQEKNDQIAKLQELLTLKQNELDTTLVNHTRFLLEENNMRLEEKNGLSEIISALQKECNSLKDRMSSFNNRENDLLHQLFIQDRIRTQLHNRVMQLTGNMRVFVRVRPALRSENPNIIPVDTPFVFPSLTDRDPSVHASNNDEDLTKRLLLATEPYKDRGGLTPRQKKYKFAFDHVFSPMDEQDCVWSAVEPLIQSCIDGFNVCIFAYGETGSGKTFTMFGNEGAPGIIQRSINKLFSSKVSIKSPSINVKISVESLEIYNEQVRDLLSPQSGIHGYKEVCLRLNTTETVGNTVLDVENEHDVCDVLSVAQRRRCVRATKSNDESSRSHLLFTLNYDVTSDKCPPRHGRLYICDLAGSERLSKSESAGISLKETQHINLSLSSLSHVIEKLQDKSSHIPYRDSTLTFLLRNSLGGDSKTAAIICCNPLSDHFQESLCSLRFAQRASKVELKKMSDFSA